MGAVYMVPMYDVMFILLHNGRCVAYAMAAAIGSMRTTWSCSTI